MCDEYDEERMRAFWRAIAAARAPEIDDVEREDASPILAPALSETRGPSKPRSKALMR